MMSATPLMTLDQDCKKSYPGAGILHPVAWLSLILLVLNDDYFKGRFHNAITGKLSDVAGVVFMPLLVVALAESFRFWLPFPALAVE